MTSKKIDPRHFMPPIEGYEHADVDVSGSAAYGAPDSGGGGGSDTTPEELSPPDNLYVVDQVFRRAADGRTVVDLVFEVDDVDGAMEYEIRRATT